MDEWESVALLTGRAELDRDTVAVAERGRGGWEHGSGTGGESGAGQGVLLDGRGGWVEWEWVVALTGRGGWDGWEHGGGTDEESGAG